MTSELLARSLTALAVVAAGCATSPTPHYRDIDRSLHERGGPKLPAGMMAPSYRAESPGTMMSVEDAVRVALSRNEGLRARLAGVGTDVGHLLDARSVANPEAELTALLPATADRAFSLEVGLLQQINDFALRSHRSAAARATLEQTKLGVVQAIVGLSSRTRGAVYAYLAAKRVLAVRKASTQAATTSAEIAERVLDAGNTSKIDVIRRQVARDEAMLAERMAARNLVRAREGVSRLLAVSADEAAKWEIVAELPPVPPITDGSAQELESRALTASLELRAGALAITAATARRALARASAWPHLSVGVIADIEPGEGSVGVGPAIELEIPIFSFGRGAAAAANWQLEAVRHESAQRAVEVLSAARTAQSDLSEAHQRARHLEDSALPLRRQLTREMLKMYNGMYVGVFELLRTKQDELETEVMWIESVRDYWTARADVDLVLAGGTPSQQMAGPSVPIATSAGGDAH